MAFAITDERATVVPVRQHLWHEKAPRKLVERCPEDDLTAGWPTWQNHLRARRKPATAPFLTKKQPPLLWGWPIAWQRDAIQASLESTTSLAEIAIGDDATLAPDLPSSLQLVALAYALPKLAQELPAETWWFLIERLQTTAIEARRVPVEWFADSEGVVRNQLLSGELPFALGYLFPEVQALHALRDEARVALSAAIVELTDGQGLPHARLLPVLGPLLGCWTRCRWLGKGLGRGAWSRTAEQQYEWLVRHAIRLAAGGGRFLLTPEGAGGASGMREDAAWGERQWSKSLFETAIGLAGDRGDHAAAAQALPRGVVAKPKRFRRAELPKPSLNSDWAGITIMADGWCQSGARVALEYAGDALTIELGVDGESLLWGAWDSHTSCDGRELRPASEWEQLCWESGRQFDFLELGQDLTEGVRLERQILFGREDRILYLADILRSGDGMQPHLEHLLELPLAPTVRWNAETETRDGLLTCGRTRAAVMPLSLREWRADPRGGSLAERNGRLVLAQETRGRALCSALVIDLDRKRSRTKRTWRQLTVAEWMEIVPADVAVGYRAQSGDDQWLIYRSLGPAGNRTLLGHNVAGEFCAGRFRGGKFKEWIEIEAV
jgi:hypothetical protein